MKPFIVKTSLAIATAVMLLAYVDRMATAKLFLSSNSAVVQTATTQAQAVTASTTAEAKQMVAVDADKLQNVLTKYENIEASVAVIDAEGNETVAGSADAYIAASTTKVITAIAALQAYGLDKVWYIEGYNVQDLVTAMIVQSDNEAWYTLEQELGSSAHALVASAVDADTYDFTTNSISALDMARIYSALYSGSLLPSDESDWLMSLLQQANYTSYMYAVVPSGVAAYHKVGFLYDRLHEVITIDTGTTFFTLAVYTKTTGNYDFEEGRAILQDVFNEVYEELVITGSVSAM